jgi:hypothetical protein
MADVIPLKFGKTGSSVTSLDEFATGDTIPAAYLPAASGGGDLSYTFTQGTASDTWTIAHNLGKFPSVTVVDSAGNVGFGSVKHTDANNLVVSFGAAFAGKAYLN